MSRDGSSPTGTAQFDLETSSVDFTTVAVYSSRRYSLLLVTGLTGCDIAPACLCTQRPLEPCSLRRSPRTDCLVYFRHGLSFSQQARPPIRPFARPVRFQFCPAVLEAEEETRRRRTRPDPSRGVDAHEQQPQSHALERGLRRRLGRQARAAWLAPQAPGSSSSHDVASLLHADAHHGSGIPRERAAAGWLARLARL